MLGGRGRGCATESKCHKFHERPGVALFCPPTVNQFEENIQKLKFEDTDLQIRRSKQRRGSKKSDQMLEVMGREWNRMRVLEVADGEVMCETQTSYERRMRSYRVVIV